jgi:Transposase DDE domain group 1
MVAQRVFGIALGYRDLVDYDQLRHDPVLATLAGKLQTRRKDCTPLAGKSTLNRLEHAMLLEQACAAIRGRPMLPTPQRRRPDFSAVGQPERGCVNLTAIGPTLCCRQPRTSDEGRREDGQTQHGLDQAGQHRRYRDVLHDPEKHP